MFPIVLTVNEQAHCPVWNTLPENIYRVEHTYNCVVNLLTFKPEGKYTKKHLCNDPWNVRLTSKPDFYSSIKKEIEATNIAKPMGHIATKINLLYFIYRYYYQLKSNLFMHLYLFKYPLSFVDLISSCGLWVRWD